jgi:hypothetical protein
VKCSVRVQGGQVGVRLHRGWATGTNLQQITHYFTQRPRWRASLPRGP